jgi:hypothetical protein
MSYKFNNLKVGIELEVVDYGNTAYSFENSKWGQKGDGSLPSGGREYYTQPIFGDDINYQVDKITHSMARAATITPECGFHLHLDFSNARFSHLKRFYRFCRHVYPFFQTQFAPRFSTSWCRAFSRGAARSLESKHTSDFIRTVTGGSRYHWINFDAWFRHGTVENRLHYGTKDKDEILTWVEFWQKAALFCQRNALPRKIPKRYKPDFVNEVIQAFELSEKTNQRFGIGHKIYVSSLKSVAKKENESK